MTDIKAKPTPLPVRFEDLVLKGKPRVTFNDHVHRVFELCYRHDPEFRAYLNEVENSAAITGAIDIDDIKACEMIQVKAQQENMDIVADAKLATIRIALHVVMNRYGLSRKVRRNTLEGKYVDPKNIYDNVEEEAA
jgi:hypothetical protein